MGGVPDKKHLVLEQTSVHKRLLANDMKTKSSSIGVMCYGHRVVFAQLVQTCFVQTKESFSGEPQTSLEAR